MKLHIYDPYNKAQEAKKDEQKGLLGLLAMIIIGLLMTFAPMIDRFMDMLLFKAGM